MKKRLVHISITVSVTAAPAAAQTVANWLNPVSGDWTDPTMWSSNPFYPNNGNPSGTTYHAVIGPGAEAPYSVQFDADVHVTTLSLTSSAARVNATSGSLTLNALNQSGGTLSLAGANVALNGIASLTGGRVLLSGGTLNSTGSFNSQFDVIAAQVEQSGGVHLGQRVGLGEGAAYRLSGGTLTLTNVSGYVAIIGRSGSGSFHQSGGVCRVSAGSWMTLGIPADPPPLPQRGTMIIEGPSTQFSCESLPTLPDALLYVGWGTNALGTTTVRDSAAAHFGHLSVGVQSGNGTFHVTTGARVSAASVTIGFPTSGGGALWTGNGTLLLDHPAASFTVGSLACTVGSSQGGSGRLVVSAGTLTVSPPITSTSPHMSVGRDGRFDFLGGRLDVQRRFVVSGGHFSMGGGTATSVALHVVNGGTVSILGGDINAGSVVLIAGGFEQTRIDVGGTARFNASTVTLTGGRFNVLADSGLVPRLRGIFINGSGKVDVADAALVFEYDGTSLLPDVRAAILSGRNGGTWDGEGIISSVAPAQPGYAIGYAESTAMFSSFPATFGGWDIDETAVIVRYTRVGDANLDAAVNLQDFNRLASNFGIAADALWQQGDFNYDGAVNLQDFNLLAANFGLSAAGPGVTPWDWAALASAVPEPGALGAFGVAASVGMCGRRRRVARRARGASTVAGSIHLDPHGFNRAIACEPVPSRATSRGAWRRRGA